MSSHDYLLSDLWSLPIFIRWVSLETLKAWEVRVTTFPRVSLRIMNIKGGIAGGGLSSLL